MQGNNLLWRKEKLKVFFKNPANISDEEISCETIIEWMNEWRGGKDNDASSVPKFVRSEDQNYSDIRVQFNGMYIHHLHNYTQRLIFSPINTLRNKRCDRASRSFSYNYAGFIVLYKEVFIITALKAWIVEFVDLMVIMDS